MNFKEIGLKIKYFRKSLDLTQKQLAEKIGTTWEMISRYETGKSSPLPRIDRISKALNVPIHRILEDEGVHENARFTYRNNTVPFITSSFTDIEKSIKETKTYYTAPNWIINRFSNVFVMKSELLEFKTTKIDQTGLIFVTQEDPESHNDMIIVKNNGELQVLPAKNKRAKEKIVGTIIAWEKRFK